MARVRNGQAGKSLRTAVRESPLDRDRRQKQVDRA